MDLDRVIEPPVTPPSDLYLTLAEQVVAEYREALWRFFRRRVAIDADAEDLTQETLFRVTRDERSFPSRRDFENFLFKAAANAWRSHGRYEHAQRRSHVSVPLDEPEGEAGRRLAESLAAPAGPETDPELALLQGEADQGIRGAVAAAIDAMPPQMRRCARLYYHQGKTGPEIARLMKISDGGVKAHLFQARLRLREALRPWRS
jgi:RNA polymerase sigma factor (sigma-70 family)